MGFGVLAPKSSFLAEDSQYVVSTGVVGCRGSVWILLVARVGVRCVRGSVVHLVVEVDDGTKHGMGVGMGCARGRSGRVRRGGRLVLGASYGVGCCVGVHNPLSRGRSGLSRSRAAVMDGVTCNTSRDALGTGDEGRGFLLSTLCS